MNLVILLQLLQRLPRNKSLAVSEIKAAYAAFLFDRNRMVYCQWAQLHQAEAVPESVLDSPSRGTQGTPCLYLRYRAVFASLRAFGLPR
jgi:hypothetical protein